MTKFWLVHPSQRPFETYAEALENAQHQARATPWKSFYVMKSVALVRANMPMSHEQPLVKRIEP